MSRITANDAFVVEIRRASIEEVVDRLMSVNLLKTSMVCSICASGMSLVKDTWMADGKSWRCPNSRCGGNRKRTSVRKDSFFEGCRRSLGDTFCVMYYWAAEKPVAQVVEDLGIARGTAVDIYSRIRQKVAEHIDATPLQLGGPGIVCQIDESCFSHKIKAHRGRAPEDPIWVFGIIDSSLVRRSFHIEVVGNRSANTLLPIIERHTLPGTVIHSDEWAAYGRISSTLGLAHGIVNHSRHFVDPNTGVHTQRIESLWNALKYKIKRMKGVRREHLPLYLKEFMWRNRFQERPYVALFGLFKVFQ